MNDLKSWTDNDLPKMTPQERGVYFRRQTRTGLRAITPEEQERRYQAALRCRERLISIPFYAKRDREWGMTFWLNYQGSAALADQ